MLIRCSGGSSESVRARQLTKELNLTIPLKAEQIIQGHTSFKNLASTFADVPVLLVGFSPKLCTELASEYVFKSPTRVIIMLIRSLCFCRYGFNATYTVVEILHSNPALWPLYQLTAEEQQWCQIRSSKHPLEIAKIPFQAIFILSYPNEWSRDLQICLDILQTSSHLAANDTLQGTVGPNIPVYTYSNDLYWKNEMVQPRIGIGAFNEALKSIYLRATGFELHM